MCFFPILPIRYAGIFDVGKRWSDAASVDEIIVPLRSNLEPPGSMQLVQNAVHLLLRHADQSVSMGVAVHCALHHDLGATPVPLDSFTHPFFLFGTLSVARASSRDWEAAN